MTIRQLVVASELDPVARGVTALWGTPPATDAHLDGSPIRLLAPGVGLLRRAPLHIHDERLDQRLPRDLRAAAPTLIYPSIHRSERGDPCFTVHPLGNLGGNADVGGEPRTAVPTDPPRMTDALRRLAERATSVGLAATFEATHHGPALGLPAFFIEIGYGDDPAPSPAALRTLAEVIPQIEPTTGDRVVVGVGGGHYAPHFTDLALKRRWAFGHLVSRHALAEADVSMVRAVVAATPGWEGTLFARAADAASEVGRAFGPRLSEGSAPARAPPAALG